MDEILKSEPILKSGEEKVDEAVMQNADPKAEKEHWIFLEEFCYVCLKRRVYLFCRTPVPRVAILCCQECRAKFQGRSDYHIQRHNLFMKYLQEEERNAGKGAIGRALQRVLNPDPSVR